MNEQAKKLEREAMFWSAWKHVESHRNDVATSNYYYLARQVTVWRSNKNDNNDPCMLRHTAGATFYQGLDFTLALNKSSLIDSEGYVMQEAA